MWRAGGVVTAAIIVALLVGVLAATSAGAATLTPAFARFSVGSTRFVQIKPFGHHLRTVVLTPRGRAELKQQHVLGHKGLVANCTVLGREVRGAYPDASTSSEAMSARDRPSDWVAVIQRHADFCDIGLAPHTQAGLNRDRGDKPYDSIALDHKGAAYLEDDNVTLGLLGLELAVEQQADAGHGDAYPTPAQLLTSLGSPRLIVALPRASATPPRGSYGYYSNGRGWMSLVVVDPSGHRLFVEQHGDVESSNDLVHVERLESFAPGYLEFYGGPGTARGRVG